MATGERRTVRMMPKDWTRSVYVFLWTRWSRAARIRGQRASWRGRGGSREGTRGKPRTHAGNVRVCGWVDATYPGANGPDLNTPRYDTVPGT